MLGEITLDREAVLWIGGPPFASLVVLAVGALFRGDSPRAGTALLVVGAVGLGLSALWIAFGFYVDAHVK